ncbi:TatD family deoxyribonuclease [bacterium]|nr:MAG: TatD family deoxyribonuclease [bacterium]
MQPKFFDAHTHVNLAAFSGDYKETIGRSLDAGVGMVNIGTQKNTSLRAIEIAREFRDVPVFATVGLHPTHACENDFRDAQELAASAGVPETFNYDFYRGLALDSKVMGIGECGLDYFRLSGDVGGKKNKQKEAFIEQIKLAHEVKKPLMIHCRSAFPELIETLEENKGLLNDKPGIIHFFSGTRDEAEKLAGLGFYFTFGGVITFARDYDEVIKFLPIERILSETDAPYVAPTPYRGKRNEPAYVIEVVKKLAEIKEMPLEEISRQILKNTEDVFDLDI